MNHNWYIELADESYLTAQAIEDVGPAVKVDLGRQQPIINRNEITRIEQIEDRETDAEAETITLTSGETIAGELPAEGKAREYAR